jgi:hypothetical protein
VGRMPLRVEIVNAQGEVETTLSRD